MKLQSGIEPVKKDHRDYSLKRTFGAVVLQFPPEYSCDAGLTMPDQMADGRPFGCTGYTQSELCQDQDCAKYDPGFTYDKGRLIDGTAGEQVGVDLRSSLKSTIVYGVRKEGETEEQAWDHRRGGYFNVDDISNYDRFDDQRAALWLNRLDRRAVSAGIPWFPEWERAVGPNGVLPVPSYNVKIASWHNVKISGWKLIHGVLYLAVKSWQGANYGDHGWVYMSREIANRIFAINGSAAFTVVKAKPEDVMTIQLNILDTILSYLRMILKLVVKETMK